MSIGVLFTVILLLSPFDKPASKALFQCDELLAYGNDDGSGDEGPVPADSRGAVVIEGELGDYHCRAWKDKYTWQGTITVKHSRERIYIRLEPEAAH